MALVLLTTVSGPMGCLRVTSSGGPGSNPLQGSVGTVWACELWSADRTELLYVVEDICLDEDTDAGVEAMQERERAACTELLMVGCQTTCFDVGLREEGGTGISRACVVPG